MLYSIIFGLAATASFANGAPTNTPDTAPVVTIDIFPEVMVNPEDFTYSSTHVPLNNTATTPRGATAISAIYSNYDIKTNCEFSGFDPSVPGATPALITLVAPEWGSADPAPRDPLYDIIPSHIITSITCKPKENQEDSVLSLVFKSKDGTVADHQWEVEVGHPLDLEEEEEFIAISFSSNRKDAKDICTVNGGQEWVVVEGGVSFKTPVKLSDISCTGVETID